MRPISSEPSRPIWLVRSHGGRESGLLFSTPFLLLTPSTSSADREISHKPAEDCASGDNSACFVGVQCGILITSVSWLMINESVSERQGWNQIRENDNP